MGRMETMVPVPPAAVSRVLATFDRDQLAGFIAVAIDLLDFAQGDPDIEEDDDPGQCDEDGVNTNLAALQTGSPGCTISDGGDIAYSEWDTRGRRKLSTGGFEPYAGHNEDDEEDDAPEEDDPSGQCDEDGINTSAVQFQPSGPGCEISDPGGEDAYGEDAELTPDYGIDQTECLPAAIVIASDRQNMRPHRDRVRRDACDKFTRWGETEYRLRDRYNIAWRPGRWRGWGVFSKYN